MHIPKLSLVLTLQLLYVGSVCFMTSLQRSLVLLLFVLILLHPLLCCRLQRRQLRLQCLRYGQSLCVLESQVLFRLPHFD